MAEPIGRFRSSATTTTNIHTHVADDPVSLVDHIIKYTGRKSFKYQICEQRAKILFPFASLFVSIFYL